MTEKTRRISEMFRSVVWRYLRTTVERAVQTTKVNGLRLIKRYMGVTDFICESKTRPATPGRFWLVRGCTLRDREGDDDDDDDEDIGSFLLREKEEEGGVRKEGWARTEGKKDEGRR